MKTFLPFLVIAFGVVASFQRNSDRIDQLEKNYERILKLEEKQAGDINANENCILKITEHVGHIDADIKNLKTAIDRSTQEQRAGMQAILDKLEDI